jgi:hypothetical protein
MKLTGAAILVSRGMKVLQAARQLILIVRRGGEEALDTDDDVGAIGGEGVEQDLLVGFDFRLADDVAGMVENADGEESGVQIDTAVELVGTVVEVHGASPEGPVGA